MPSISTSRRSLAKISVLGVALALLVGAAPLAAAKDDGRVEAARVLVEAEKPEEALELLDQVLGKKRNHPGALLLRSTARVMLGDLKGGRDDLERALDLDPRLRQAWLNLAGLEIASQNYDNAYEALLRARELDPEASDNGLNLGAVQVLRGEVDDAGRHFAEYLAERPDDAEAYYQVAANYALGGFEAPAIDHLRRAVELEERLRFRARSDNRFVLLQGEGFRKLLATDLYRAPAGALEAAAAFGAPYDRAERRLLEAVLRALGRVGWRYDPRIEATDRWAVIWSNARIKLSNQKNGTGVVSLSAPAGSFTASEWQAKTEALFRAIHQALEE